MWTRGKLKNKELIFKASVREETFSSWKQTNEFKGVLQLATRIVLKEIAETNKNILIFSQNIILDALSKNDLDLFKKANLALRYLSLIKGIDDIAERSENKIFKHSELGNFVIRNLINIK